MGRRSRPSSRVPPATCQLSQARTRFQRRTYLGLGLLRDIDLVRINLVLELAGVSGRWTLATLAAL